MYLASEESLLDQDFRKKIIDDINSKENKERKELALKKFECFYDNTRKYVLEKVPQDMGENAKNEIINRICNISFLRKVINKKGQVYRNGAIRKVEEHPQQEQIQQAVDFYIDELNLNSQMKIINAFLELHKNVCYFISPYKDPFTNNYKIRGRVIFSHLYDVVTDAENPTIPRVYILNYKEGDKTFYIFWSTLYHFTVNEKGEIVSMGEDSDNLNPIETLPFVSFTKNINNESYWNKGGDDLLESNILINLLLTDLYYISKLQGQGVFYIIGPRVPKTLKIGPSDAIIIEKKDGDPSTEIGYATSNPPIDSHMRMIEQHVALLLSTNNLEPSSVSGQLNASNANSGIQEIIRKSENQDDIEDQKEHFRDMEPYIFKIVFLWHNLFYDKKLLDEKYAQYGKIPLDFDLTLKFPAPQIVITDKDKLDIIEKRRDLELDTKIDSLIRDNPDLSIEEAQNKLQELEESKGQLNIVPPVEKENPPVTSEESNGVEEGGL